MQNSKLSYLARIFPLSIFLLLHCSSEQASSVKSLFSDEPLPLEKKIGRQSFCGTEALSKVEHPSCGTRISLERRTQACGPETFRERASLSCPGSVAHDVQEIQTSGACRHSAVQPQCPSGYHPIGEQQKKDECFTRFGRSGDIQESRWEFIKEWHVTCERDEVLQKCRLPEFDVEEYKLCRHESHGPESFNACEVPGVSSVVYKECAYYLTIEEARIYLRQQQSLINSRANDLLYYRSDVLSLQNNQAGFACLIRSLDADATFESTNDRLKKLYAGTFGEKYDNFNGLCQENLVASAPSCEDGDASKICQASRSYETVKRWFVVLRQDVEHLLGDSHLKEDALLLEGLNRLHMTAATMLSPQNP